MNHDVRKRDEKDVTRYYLFFTRFLIVTILRYINIAAVEYQSKREAELPRGGADRERGHRGGCGGPAQVVQADLAAEPPPAQRDGLHLVLEQVRAQGEVVVADVLLPVQLVQTEIELGAVCRL